MIGPEFFMQQALAESKKAFEEDEVPVGAVIVYENCIIGRAHNQIRMLKDPTAHAEIIAITQAADYLKNERLLGCTLYSTLEPCPMCVGASILARIDSIVFAAWDPKAGACGSAVNLTEPGLLNHTVEVTGGILESECRTILQEFFLSKR